MILEKKSEIDRLLNNINTKSPVKAGLRKLNSIRKISEKLNYRYDEILYHNSVHLNLLGDTDKAIIHIEKCIEIQKEGKDKQKYANSLSYYGNLLNNLGNYEKAFEVLNAALKIQKVSGDIRPLIYTFIRIGNLQRIFLNDIPKSILIYNTALKLSIKLKDKKLIASCRGSLANSYLYEEKYPESKIQYESSAQLFQEIGDNENYCRALLGLGTAFRGLNNIKYSIQTLTNALEISKRLKNLSRETSICLNLAISYLSNDDKKNADNFYKRSMSLIKKINAKNLQWELYFEFAHVYEKKKDFEKAYRHYVTFHNLYSESFKEESERLNKMMLLKYEKEKSKNEAEIYKLKNREFTNRD